MTARRGAVWRGIYGWVAVPLVLSVTGCPGGGGSGGGDSGAAGPGERGARAWVGPEGTVDVLGYADERVLALRGPLYRARLDGPAPVPGAGVFVLSWLPETAGFAVPGPPQPASPLQCADGFDNDPDGYADECDHNCVLHPAFDGARYGDQPPTLEHARNVALVGDAIWCTMRSETWITELIARGQDAAQYLNWIEIPPEYDQGRRPAPVVVRDLACVVAPDEAAARDCHEDGEPCAGILDGYPLAGVRRLASFYIDHAWDYFVWLLDGAGAYDADGPAPVPVSLLQVVAGYEELYETIQSLSPIAGLAEATHFQPHLGNAGASVVVGGGPFDKRCNGAHEFGHTLGLPHDLGQIEVPGVGTLLGLMHFQGGDCVPVLGKRDHAHAPQWSIADKIMEAPNYHPYQAWADFASGKEFPRWDGFSYVGCSDSTHCPLDFTCRLFSDGGFMCW